MARGKVCSEGYAHVMRVRTLVLVALLVVAAFALAKALITRDGVGAFEYAVGIALILGLVSVALQLSRRALQRG
jgi:hypothetical protein